jgi:hypothetical protein
MFAMVLLGPPAIRLIFMAVPFMIVVVLFVVIGASGPLILGSQRCGRDCYWDHKGGAEQDCIQETGHNLFSYPVIEQVSCQAFADERNN